MPKYAFYTSCPGCDNKTKYYWFHSGCRGDMEIWHDGDLECNRCNKMGFILDWKFDCGDHGENTYIGPNPQKLVNSLTCLSELTSMPMKNVFDIIEKIRKKCGI